MIWFTPPHILEIVAPVEFGAVVLNPPFTTSEAGTQSADHSADKDAPAESDEEIACE
ncbi:MAG: hypothetical protein IPK79_00465 [Vampirovibrionales bacterium]|nr:hypothetical protein [Vampirovibrionales bacterium]